MEKREGNVIVCVDKILDQDKTKFVDTITRLLDFVVEETNADIISVALDTLARTTMVLRVAKEMMGDKNE